MVHLIQKHLSDRKDVLLSLRQRRKLNRKDTESVIQILAEGSLRNHLLQIAVGRTDDPDIHMDVLNPADTADIMAFQHAKQFCLKRQ